MHGLKSRCRSLPVLKTGPRNLTYACELSHDQQAVIVHSERRVDPVSVYGKQDVISGCSSSADSKDTRQTDQKSFSICSTCFIRDFDHRFSGNSEVLPNKAIVDVDQTVFQRGCYMDLLVNLSSPRRTSTAEYSSVTNLLSKSSPVKQVSLKVEQAAYLSGCESSLLKDAPSPFSVHTLSSQNDNSMRDGSISDSFADQSVEIAEMGQPTCTSRGGCAQGNVSVDDDSLVSPDIERNVDTSDSDDIREALPKVLNSESRGSTNVVEVDPLVLGDLEHGRVSPSNAAEVKLCNRVIDSDQSGRAPSVLCECRHGTRNQTGTSVGTDFGSTSLTNSSSEGDMESREDKDSTEDESSDSPENGSDTASSTGVNLLQDQIHRSNLALLKQELQHTANERDSLRDELQKTRIRLDQFMSFDGKMNEGGNYDWLKTQWETAMNELQSLKKQNSETVKKFDQTVKEADYYREKYKVTHDTLKRSNNEIQTMRLQYSNALTEKDIMKQDNKELREQLEKNDEEIRQLHSQQREVMSKTGSSEVLNKMYDTAFEKYEATKRDYDKLRKRHAELIASHSDAVGKLELMQKDHELLKKQIEDLVKERDAVKLERNGLKQQCTVAIMKWDNAQRDMSKFQEHLTKTVLQRDESLKELNQVMALRVKDTKELARIKAERDDAVREYKLIMSERDSVHTEIEQLQDKLNEATRRMDGLLHDNKIKMEESEGLKQKVTSLQLEKEHLMKDIEKTQKDNRSSEAEKAEITKERDDSLKENEILIHQRDTARKERNEAITDRDRCLHDAYKNRQHENSDLTKEAEMLKKEAERLQTELKDIQQDADESKRKREWAFLEREKVLQERESIRTLCDKLRKDRDHKVSDLAEAIRETDELKKQKNDAVKEMQETKEKYEAVMEKENRKQQLNSVFHNHSRDSAIDTDLQDWETETLEFDIGGSDEEDMIGFDLVGGKDDPQFPNDYSIFVRTVSKGSGADGKLKVNDQILKINNIDVTNVEKRVAVQALQASGGSINMVIRRRKCPSLKAVVPISLNLNGSEDIGLQLEQGVFITKINPNSVAAKDSNLNAGDRIVSINGISIEGKSINEVVPLIQNVDIISMSVQRFMPYSAHSPQFMLDSPTREHAQASLKPRSRSPIKLFNPSQHDSNDNIGLNSPLIHREDHSKSKETSFLSRAVQKFQNALASRSRKGKDRDDRLSKSGTVIIDSLELAALGELDTVIAEHAINSPTTERQSNKKKDSNEQENGGTWPRSRHVPLELAAFSGTETVHTSLFSPKKDRPSIEEHFTGSRNNAYNSSLRNPPMPPERGNSSFAASIRHSPQNSDVSVKYPNTMKPVSSPFLPSLSLSQSNGTKRPFTDLDSPLGTEQRIDPRKTPIHYPTHSSPNSSVGYSTSGNSTPGGVVDFPSNIDGFYQSAHHGRHNKPTSSARRRPTSGPRHRPHRSPHSPTPKPNTLYVRPQYPEPQVSPHMMTSPDSRQITPQNGNRSLSTRSPLSPMESGFPNSKSNSMYGQYGQFNTLPNTKISPVQMSLARQTQPLPPYQAISKPSPGTTNTSLNSSISEMSDFMKPQLHPIDRYTGYSTSPSPSNYSVSTTDRATPTPSEEIVRISYARQYTPHSNGAYSKHGHGHSGRIRIASRNSIISSERSSPLSPQCSDCRTGSSTGSIPYSYTPVETRDKPKPGETRPIEIERSSDTLPLGIQIKQIKYGGRSGIFVSNVTERSLAACFGIFEGDQLLEVCGINMRSAHYDHAANVLRNCGDTITLLVQYNPKKYEGIDTSSDGESSFTASPPHSPELTRPLKVTCKGGSNETITSSTPITTPRNHPCNASNNSQRSRDSRRSSQNSQIRDTSHLISEPRFVFLKKTTQDLGISVIGGNATGIFVHEVQKDTIASGHSGLRCGDQILEFNGTNLRSATAEQAYYELFKPADTVTILAQYNLAKYSKIQENHGDSFYVRALFSRRTEVDGELDFERDDVLYVEDTLYGGIPGLWKAWLVDDEGMKLKPGTIPNKLKVEDELSLKRSLSEATMEEELKSARRGSASSRRSFFRKRKHQRNNSKDSRELHSFSDVSISSDSVPMLDDKCSRPVIVLSPLAEPLIEKLTSEAPDRYNRVPSELMKASIPAMEKGQADGHFINYKSTPKADCYECIRTDAVKEICDLNRHPLLNVNPYAIGRLHRLQIYPIVVFVKHKSPKQIRDVKDIRFLPDKFTNKVAKEQFDNFQRYDLEFKHLFTVTVNGGNLAYMCKEIKSVIDVEQRKIIWIPTSSF